MEREEIIKLIEEKEIELKKLLNEINTLKQELQKQNSSKVQEMTIDEKIELYTSYFKGRDDVYPYLSINKNDPTKKYYIPACTNEWRQGICNKYIHCSPCDHTNSTRTCGHRLSIICRTCHDICYTRT